MTIYQQNLYNIQALGPNGIQLITKLMNKIYNTGVIPDDFLQNIFITIPKTSNAQDCSDFRTISLISHVSKILLHLMPELLQSLNVCWQIVRWVSEKAKAFDRINHEKLLVIMEKAGIPDL